MKQTLSVFSIISIIISFNLNGQDSQPLPQLLPAHTQSFSPQTNYSRLCFSDVFLGANGRLWLNTCDVEKTIYSLPIVQFDGYQFFPVKLDALQAPEGSYLGVVDFTQEGQLQGYYHGKGQEAFYSINLNTTQAELFPLEGLLPEGSRLRSVFQTKEKEWFFFVKVGSNLHIYRRIGDALKLELEVPYPATGKQFDLNKPRSVQQDGDDIWFLDYYLFMIRWNKKTGAWKKYSKEDFDFDLQTDPVFMERWWALPNPTFLAHGGTFIIGLPSYDKAPFFKFETASDRFIPLSGFPEEYSAKAIYKDQVGNLVYLYTNEEGDYRGILEDNQGKRYDFSTIISQLKFKKGQQFINKLVGQNFKQQLFICTNSGLFSVAVRPANLIQHFIPGADIRAMAQLSDGTYIVNAVLEGWYHLDVEQQKAESFTALESEGNPFQKAMQRKVEVLENGQVLTVHKKKFVLYDWQSQQWTNLPAGEVFYFVLINQDTLAYWDGEKNSLNFYDLKNRVDVPYLENGQPFTLQSHVQEMRSSRDGQLWIVTTNGLWKVDYQNNKSIKIGDEPGFKDSRFITMYEEEDGRLWLGTYLGGVHIYDPQKGVEKVLVQEQGLTNNTIVSILKDDDDVFWIGTYNGISLVSKEGEVITNLREPEGLIGSEFNRYAHLKGRDGSLLLGTIEGLNVINPKELKAQLAIGIAPSVYLTGLTYFNSEEERDVRQWEAFDFNKTIQLPAGERYLTLQFSLSSYIQTDKNQFAYKLLRINEKADEKEWIYLGNQHNLSLTNLPVGNYELWINGSDYKGNWGTEPIRLSIHAHEYFYKQIWFYVVLVGIISLLSFFWVRRLLTERSRLEKEVGRRTKQIREDKEIIEQQADDLKQLDDLKSRFFTNISHEFRTPLTIILGMADQVIENPVRWAEKGAALIKRNSTNLLRLINQILDLRKLESGTLQLNMVQGDLIPYIRYIFESFHSYAAQKKVKLNFQADEPLVMDYEPDKLLKILYNLLSNAIKFTGEGGEVFLKVSKGNGVVEIRVKDTGIGIHEEKLPNIFERFYQVDDSSTRKEEGTGIGLTFTKELVKVLDGQIKVQSKLGKGSIFIVELPVNNQAPFINTSRKHDQAKILESFAPLSTIQDKLPVENLTTSEEFPSLLIVEDNADVVDYLKMCLLDQYNLMIAKDGQEGIDMAIEHVPDIIISDVMMPRKNGFELCDIIKNDERTSHIPIIMLTARADTDSRIEGLESGADAYLAKPFNKEELFVRLRKLIELRRRMQERYKSLEPTRPTEDVAFQKEDEFIKKVKQEIHNHLDDEQYGIAQLCSSVTMSRSQLHRKLKALTGLSTSNFIRSIRLGKAKELLETTDLNISEIAHEVGFGTLKYFSQAFTDAFGQSPSEFRK